MQIYNIDESGVTVVHKTSKVISEIKRRCAWSLSLAEKGKTHTMITCVSASGFPPFMIYPRKHMDEKLKEGAFPGTSFNCSDNEWVTQELYYK